MKRVFLFLMLGLVCTTVITSCEDENREEKTVSIPLTGITVPANVSILVNEKQRITATPVPADATDVWFEWSSDDPSAATVYYDGTVLIKKYKTTPTIITVRSGSVEAKVAVSVTEVPLTGITAPESIILGTPGIVQQITATMVPANATGVKYVWTSANTDIVTVDTTGKVTATGFGETEITVSHGSIKATVAVVVGLYNIYKYPVGLWTFDDLSDFAKATIGMPLETVGIDFETAEGGIRVKKGSYFIARHGIAAGRGGSNVNEYTLMIDFSIPQTGVYHTIFQTDLVNSNDAECFIRSGNHIGIGTPGYSTATVEANRWYRLVISFKGGAAYKIYLNGENIHSTGGDNAAISVYSRFSWSPNGVILFGDEDGEDADIDVSKIAIWDIALSDEEIAILGNVN
jgi:hypothetical protein